LYPIGVTKSSRSGHSGPEVESSARGGSSDSGNSLGWSTRTNATPQRAVPQKRRACEPLPQRFIIRYSRSRWWSRAQSPLHDHWKVAEAIFNPMGLHPSKAVAALVEEIYVNDRVIHQVLSNPRKVDQWGYIMEGELSSWSDTRQHQNLHINVRLGDAKQRRLPT
jgi:hypothetical protein